MSLFYPQLTCLSSPWGRLIDKEKFPTQLILARSYLTSQLTVLRLKFSEICQCPGLWTLCSSSRTVEVFGQTTLKTQQRHQLVRPRQTPWWFCFGTDEILPEWESIFPAFLGVKQSLALRLSDTTAHTVCLSLQAAWNRRSESCSASPSLQNRKSHILACKRTW